MSHKAAFPDERYSYGIDVREETRTEFREGAEGEESRQRVVYVLVLLQ